ncbi:MAG: (deoxy)nucleoside triphosphate pyrophosphohydrolase [Solobacterium sp.]|jgi:8-oxo-dGTP diphosphatase|nr:(deoxy)nucleoside triphosphate pyrophosphohydrolase [Solobacterium sp.]
MKTIRVTAAVIVHEGRIFATQRGYGPYKDGWEFPGGKIEAGETPEQTIVREIREELNITIAADRYITTIEYDYPDFHLSMDCFYAHIEEGQISLLEHEAARWITKDQLDEIPWLPADLLLIPYLKQS